MRWAAVVDLYGLQAASKCHIKEAELYLRHQTEMANYVTCCVAKPDDAGTKMRFVLSLKVPRTKAEDKSEEHQGVDAG